MTVFAFSHDEADNPLAGLTLADIRQLPFGAAELDKSGAILSYIDTEPGGGTGQGGVKVGEDFFTKVAPWAGRSRIGSEFRQGVESGVLNAVFDCAAVNINYKVRVHLKISPILGTFWVFVKKLTR